MYELTYLYLKTQWILRFTTEAMWVDKKMSLINLADCDQSLGSTVFSL